MNKAKMLHRLINKGANPVEAIKLLEEQFATFSGKNLIVALRYWDFITEAQANKMERVEA
jgi:hypothetical protein